MLIRVVDLWVVKKESGLQHLEMIIQDSKVIVCLSVCIYLSLLLLNEHRLHRMIKFTWQLRIGSLKIGLNNLLNMKHIVYKTESLWLMEKHLKYAQISWKWYSIKELLFRKWQYPKHRHTNTSLSQLSIFLVENSEMISYMVRISFMSTYVVFYNICHLML